MKDEILAAFIKEHEAALSGEAARRMAGDERMARIANQREMNEGLMSAQALAFWLKAMASDLTLGMDAAMREGLAWSMRLAAGHGLDFAPGLYTDAMDTIFTTLTTSDDLPPDLESIVEAYHVECDALVTEVVGGAR
jgi:hypothetical protein